MGTVDMWDAYDDCVRIVEWEQNRIAMYPAHPASIQEILERIHARIVARQDMNSVPHE